jgi:nitrogen fixation/metabolism regulation signal transduction histidine kinase
LWRTSEAGIAQSHKAVQQGEQVVARGREVLKESQKVSAVVQMNIVRDPVYGANPALLEAFRADAQEQDARLLTQQRALEQQSLGLKEQAANLAAQQRTMLITLCVALGLLVVLTGFAGIIVTHRVAGPIFKMKRQLREVGAGHLNLPTPLRRGDELVDFFQAFDSMVRRLRERQEQEIEELERAIAALEPRAEPGELEALQRLRDRMKATLSA